MFKVIVASGKDFADQAMLNERLDYYLQSKQPDIEIVTGFSLASDQLATAYAAAKGYIIKHFPGGFRHMEAMIKYSNAAIVFHDRISTGAGKLIADCREANLHVKVIPYVPGAKAPKMRKFAPIVIEGEELIEEPKATRKKKPRPPGDNKWKIRYQQAHEAYFAAENPLTYKDGHYLEPVYPKVRESNGLQTAIVNFLNWSGHRAKRINNMGRQVNGKWIKSAAGKGQADVSATLWGRSTQLEVKTGADKPSADQLKEQAKERKAGGIYEFVYSIEQFFEVYDNLKTNCSTQVGLF